MKEGVWGIGLMIISLITFAVVGTMSNITTTNQQDYEFMKSSVEAAMYDARDEIQYRRGICICTKQGGSPATINYKTEYDILRPNDESECDGIEGGAQKYQPDQCRYYHGEYVLNSDIFVESLISRFGTVAKNQETYDITVQDVIEYPPKTSVKVVYYQYLFEAMGQTHEPIINKMDAIFEGKEIDVDEPSGKATVKVGIKNCEYKFSSGSVTIERLSDHATTTVNVSAGESATTVPSGYNDVGSYIIRYEGQEVSYTVDPNDVGKEIVAYVWEKDLKDCPCPEPETPPEETPDDPGVPSGGDCKWHWDSGVATCRKPDNTTTAVTYSKGSGKATCKSAWDGCDSAAKKACTDKGYTFVSHNCHGKQTWERYWTATNAQCVQYQTKTCGSNGKASAITNPIKDASGKVMCKYKCNG